MDLVTVLATVNSAMETARIISAAGSAFDKAELRMKLADVMEALADAKIGLADIREQMDAKDREIARLVEAAQTRDEVVFAWDAIYYKDRNGDAQGRPYCVRCWIADKRVMPLSLDLMFKRSVCVQCKTEFVVDQTPLLPSDDLC